jgi:hypothetical protein
MAAPPKASEFAEASMQGTPGSTEKPQRHQVCARRSVKPAPAGEAGSAPSNYSTTSEAHLRSEQSFEEQGRKRSASERATTRKRGRGASAAGCKARSDEQPQDTRLASAGGEAQDPQPRCPRAACGGLGSARPPRVQATTAEADRERSFVAGFVLPHKLKKVVPCHGVGAEVGVVETKAAHKAAHLPRTLVSARHPAVPSPWGSGYLVDRKRLDSAGRRGLWRRDGLRCLSVRDRACRGLPDLQLGIACSQKLLALLHNSLRGQGLVEFVG